MVCSSLWSWYNFWDCSILLHILQFLSEWWFEIFVDTLLCGSCILFSKFLLGIFTLSFSHRTIHQSLFVTFLFCFWNENVSSLYFISLWILYSHNSVSISRFLFLKVFMFQMTTFITFSVFLSIMFFLSLVITEAVPRYFSLCCTLYHYNLPPDPSKS